MPPTVTSGAFPTATGTISTFEKWYMTRVNDDCAYVAAWFGTFSVSDFISWNQSVGSSCADRTRITA
ncbi:lysM domain-containing protein [Colletotrichum tofieldiae]|nr:LysM domain-containing protein [Colletotrichum tofieldiae]GKT76926.1 lysM domain-containing protein [Colletotrichum tofieldiae]